MLRADLVAVTWMRSMRFGVGLEFDTKFQRLIGFDPQPGDPQFQETRGLDDDRRFSRADVANAKAADSIGDGAHRRALDLDDRAGDNGAPPHSRRRRLGYPRGVSFGPGTSMGLTHTRRRSTRQARKETA